MSSFGRVFLAFLCLSGFGVSSLDNLLINELNFYSPESVPFVYVELYDGGRGRTPTDHVHLVFFDQNGNTYNSSDLTGRLTSDSGYLTIGSNYTPEIWPSRLQLDTVAAVGLYELLDDNVPINVELDNGQHKLLDGLVYQPPNYQRKELVRPLEMLGKGLVVEEPTSYELCYDQTFQAPRCDKAVVRCSDGDTGRLWFPGGPLTPDEVNQCPLHYYVLKEFQVSVDAETGRAAKNQFVKLSTSDCSSMIDRKSLNQLILAGFTEESFKHMDAVQPHFVLTLDNKALKDDGSVTIGHRDYPCPPSLPNCIDVPIENAFLGDEAFGIGLFWGPLEFPTLADALRLRLIDSAAYVSNRVGQSGYPFRMTGTLGVSGQDLLYVNRTYDPMNNVSFARTECNGTSKLANFVYSSPSPGQQESGADLGPPQVYFDPLKTEQQDVRINEVGMTVAREHVVGLFGKGADVDYNFVELYANKSGLDLTGVVPVIYSGWKESNYQSFLVCDCTDVHLDNNGIGVCPCPKKSKVNTTVAEVSGVVLHFGKPEDFLGIDADNGSQLHHTDSVVFQTHINSLVDLALYGKFGPVQKYNIKAPKKHVTSKLKYSISRCYGDSVRDVGWEASHAINYHVTEGGRNNCPMPNYLQIKQLIVNTTHATIQLTAAITKSAEGEVDTAGRGLPLDQITMAVVQVIEKKLTAVHVVQLTGRIHQDCDKQFIPEEGIPFDPSVSSAIVLYYDLPEPLKVGDEAPTKHFFSGVVLTDVRFPPHALLQFGPRLEPDTTGVCSLVHCEANGKWMHAQPSYNCFSSECQPCCPGGTCSTTQAPESTTTEFPTPDNLKLALFINEIYYDYETKYSYVELLTANMMFSLDQPMNMYFMVFYDAKMENNRTLEFDGGPITPFIAGLKRVAGFEQNKSAEVSLSENGPGAVCLYYKLYKPVMNLTVDCLVYTTNASNTEGLAELQAAFDPNGYAVAAESNFPYVSISRCNLGRTLSGIVYLNSHLTRNDDNLCHQESEDICLSFTHDDIDCYSDVSSDSITLLANLVEETNKLCKCGVGRSNVNFAGASKYRWTCDNNKNVRLDSAIFFVDENQAAAFMKYFYQVVANEWKTSTINGKTIKYRQCDVYEIEQKKNIDFVLITAIVSAVGVVVIVLISLFCCCRKQKDARDSGETFFREGTSNNLHTFGSSVPGGSQQASELSTINGPASTSTKRWSQSNELDSPMHIPRPNVRPSS